MPKKLIKNYSLLLQLQAKFVSDFCDVCRGAGCTWLPPPMFMVTQRGEKRKECMLHRQLFFLADGYARLHKLRTLQLRELFHRPRRSIYMHFWLSFDLICKKTDPAVAELPVASLSLQNSTFAKHDY